MRQLAPALALLPALLLAHPIRAFQQPSFRSGALGVRVDVLVTDGQKPVGGLAAPDFELRDNGVVQTVEVVDAADVPLNVVLALDTSASTAGKRQMDLIAASQALLDGLEPVDRASLTTFSHAVVPGIALTADLAAVRRELLRLTPSGRTAVRDGVYVALTTTLAQPGRSLVVVCTDGSDISSWLRQEEVIESAKRSNAVIYAVTSADARQTTSLEDLTDATGGDMLRTASSADLRSAFQKILRDFRSRYAEILGLPMHQALLSERDIAAEREGHRYGDAPLTWTTPGSAPALRIPSAEKTNAEAERLYRLALAIDPSLVEARVRLARLLDLRNRHEEAAAELKSALAANPSGTVAYYAHLVAGRAAQAMGQTHEAARHYQDAAALFPDAQSALLAASRLALLGADVPATLAPVQRLGAQSGVFTADPWWQYHLGAGRDADDLLKALWASVPR